MSVISESWSELHPALRRIVDELRREDARVEGERHRVTFLSRDAHIDASIKEGEARVRVRAYLLNNGREERSDEDVLAWVENQPRPTSGLVQAVIEEEAESEKLVPRLVFERPVEDFTTDRLRDDILQFADAWDAGGIAAVQPGEVVPEGDPVDRAPQNAWLLMGDNASFPSVDDLEEMHSEARVGVYDSIWTGPKNGELGDLALVYFISPTKAVCFVTRLASRPFWTNEFDVNADTPVDHHQWWVYITPLIEIEPIPYKTLQEAAGGHLPLRGRSGHYLSPATIKTLRLVARHPEQQALLDRVAQVPTGLAELPNPSAMTFEEWKQIPSGLLSLEAKVSEYVVEPLIVNAEVAYPGMAHIPRSFEREYRVPSGYIDYVVRWSDVPSPVAAVEVKLTILRPASGVWADSPDFRQLRRYMDDLGTPGLLVDTHRLLLVRQGADAPFVEIVRAEATWEDMALLRDLLLEQAERVTDERDAAAKRYVIVQGPHPMTHDYDSNHYITHDLCVVIAEDYDSPIQRIENIGDQRGYDLIKSYFDDYTKLTPREAVGILGASGMYRVEGESGADAPPGARVRTRDRRPLRRG